MSIEEKQALLRRQIVEKGINAAQFFQYWQGLNLQIEEVTLEHLQQLVSAYHCKVAQTDIDDNDFTDFQSPTEPKPQLEPQVFNWDLLSVPRSIKPQPRKDPYAIQSLQVDFVDETKHPRRKNIQAIPVLVGNSGEQRSITVKEVMDQSKITKLPCLKLHPSILNHHTNLEIIILKLNEEEKSNSTLIDKIWRDVNAMYSIKTIARNKAKSIGISWEVKRNHTHFEWLRRTLIKFYPGFVVPPLPAPVKREDKFKGYLRKLECFLMDSFSCPELRNSKYFEVFLSYASLADFDSFVKTSETIAKPKSLGHILNMSGTIQVLHSESIGQYAIGLQDYLEKSSQQLKTVKGLLTQINEFYQGIANLYQDLEEVFKNMAQESHSFSDQICFEKLSLTYKQIAQLANKHADYCDIERGFMETFMQSHFSFEKDRLDNMQNLISKRTVFAAQLIRRTTKNESEGMFRKLASMFGERSQCLDSPSSNLQTLNGQVGYYNSQLLKESVRCISVLVESHIDNFSNYGHSRVDNVDQMQKAWSGLLVELSKLHFST